jgi:hypothetical protein
MLLINGVLLLWLTQHWMLATDSDPTITMMIEITTTNDECQNRQVRELVADFAKE